MIYLPNKEKRGRMLIGFSPNKESIKGARANPMHFHSLGELACEEPTKPGRIVSALQLQKPLSLRSCNVMGGTNKTWLVNCASAEGAPNSIGGRGSQAGSEESDGGTARWIDDQLRRN